MVRLFAEFYDVMAEAHLLECHGFELPLAIRTAVMRKVRFTHFEIPLFFAGFRLAC